MDLKNLKSKDKIKYILKLQRKGLEPQQIADKMGYSKIKNLNQFMDRRGYENRGSKYVLKVSSTCHTDGIQDNKDVETTLEHLEDNSMVNIGQEDNCRSNVGQEDKLNSLLNSHLEIFEMLEWFKQVKAKYPTLDILNDISINYNKSNIVKTTIRVDENIWNGFSDICKNKYSHFSKVDILSQILKDFNDKNIEP